MPELGKYKSETLQKYEPRIKKILVNSHEVQRLIVDMSDEIDALKAELAAIKGEQK